MTSSPLVSVLIPLYNHEKYVEKCLDSVLNEGWNNIELIIHDDCSPDNSWEIVQSWCEKHKDQFNSIVLEQATKNRGVVGALNRLLELATGEFIICPLASDDKLLAGGIKSRVDALQNRPDWLAVFADAETIDDRDKRLSLSCLFGYFRSNKNNLLNDRTRRMEMIIRWSVPGPVIMYRRQAFDPELGVGNYNEEYCIEDRDMYLRLLKKQQLGFIENAVSQYRLHDANTIGTPKLAIKNIVDRATPLLEFSKAPSVSWIERFVARHTALALIAHAKRRSSGDAGTRFANTLIRAYHILLARPLGELYLKVR